jgi:hypothetical protein
MCEFAKFLKHEWNHTVYCIQSIAYEVDGLGELYNDLFNTRPECVKDITSSYTEC